MRKKYKAVNLFCELEGLEGLESGFAQAGVDVVFFSNSDAYCENVHKLSRSDTPLLKSDMHDLYGKIQI